MASPFRKPTVGAPMPGTDDRDAGTPAIETPSAVKARPATTWATSVEMLFHAWLPLPGLSARPRSGLRNVCRGASKVQMAHDPAVLRPEKLLDSHGHLLSSSRDATGRDLGC
jgi:hypothetical protein